jgi:Flp pilus assembly protein TadD
MMRGLLHLGFIGTLVSCACALVAVPATAQGSYSPYNESPAAALARYVRTLASDPKEFDSLIGAGKAALELGDTQAAAGFFARADEVNPRSPMPQAGMGAVAVANGEPQAALPYFKRAQQLGLPLASFACDRGLAYDLMGQQAQAQADYRAALSGLDADEARRRLALSLAISGNRNDAIQTLAPLSARGDSGVPRVRAFVLALTGDSKSAMTAIDAAMPGSWARVAPFLQRLPALTNGQKAAAVNLGLFPDSGGSAYAYAAPTPVSVSASTDRLSGIDEFLRPSTPAPSPAMQQSWQQPQPVQVAYARPPVPARAVPAAFQPKIWLQLASGTNSDDLAGRFERLKAKDPSLFDGIKPYVARSGDGSRLVIGPFRGTSDAELFAEDLESIGISPMKWTNSQADRIAPLAAQ